MKKRFLGISVLLASLLVVFFSSTVFGWKWPWEKDDIAAEVGVTDTEVVLGSHQDMSGPIAAYGIMAKNGMELRAKEINDAGGIHGRMIRMVVEDSAYDPKQAITVTNKMINKDKIFMFIANMGSPTALATKPIISGKKIPQMFPLTAATGFFKPHDRYSFGGGVPYYDQARVATKYFVKEKGKKRIGILYQDDDMGSIMKKGVVDQLAEYGMELTAQESYKRGATVFSTQMSKLKKAGVDFVMLATVIRETVGALAEAKKLQWDVEMCGYSPAYSQLIPYLAGKVGISADGFYATGGQPYIYADHANPKAREFYKNYKRTYGKDPDMLAAYGYNIVEIFKRVAEPLGRNLTRERVIDELETWTEVQDTIFDGVPTTFTSTDHQGQYESIMFQVQKNKWVKIMGPISYK